LSPYGNFQTGSNDVFLVFNYPEQEVAGYENDPTVDNSWTWSFPYDAKFKPEKRLLSTDQSFGLTQISTTADLEIVEPIDIYAKNFEFWETSVTQNFKINNVSSTPAKIAKVFRPILPGLNQTMGLRNSLRQTLTSPYTGDNGPRYLLPTSYEDSTLDSSYGYSLLLPSDVNLFAAGDHTFLSYYGVGDPGNNALTGSMYLSDTVKFLFGFGDLNTVTYAYRKFEPANSQIAYEQGFESYSDADSLTQATSAYESRGLKTSWSGDWLVREKAGEVSVGGVASWYYPNSTSGIYWTKDVNNTKILFSETSVGSSETKTEYLNVSSSFPWSIGFDFSVASDDPADQLVVQITGSNWTDTNILLLDTADNGAPDVFFRDNNAAEGYSETFTKLPGEQKSSPAPPHATGGTYDWEIVGAKDGAVGQFYYTGSNTYPIPAGEYRIKFMYQTYGASSTITCAAIDNIFIKTYDESCFPPDESKGKMGGNNYPEFRTYKVDTREDPTYAYKVPGDYGSMSSVLQDKTSLVYSGIHFGVSPVIRGWKYGLISGLPHHTKVIFRRGRYGQFRDMLEQRQYTKFVNSNVSPTDFDAMTVNGFDKTLNTTLPVQGSSSEVSLSDAIANVKFVRKITRISQRRIGTIDTEVINPEQTTSQNLSFEVTSSLPYFDLESRHRSHEEMMGVKRSSYVDTATVIASDQQLGII
jgi:hypothetical protein